MVGYCRKLTLYWISYHTSQAQVVLYSLLNPQTQQNRYDVVSGLQNTCMTYCSMTPVSKLNLHWISYHILLVQAVLLEFGRPMNTAEAPVRCSRQTSKTSDIGLSKTNNKIGNLGRSQNPRQKATGPRGYNTILWSIAVTIDSKTYKRILSSTIYFFATT